MRVGILPSGLTEQRDKERQHRKQERPIKIQTGLEGRQCSRCAYPGACRYSKYAAPFVEQSSNTLYMQPGSFQASTKRTISLLYWCKLYPELIDALIDSRWTDDLIATSWTCRTVDHREAISKRHLLSVIGPSSLQYPFVSILLCRPGRRYLRLAA